MAASALVQTRVDAKVKREAAKVLESMGLTVSDAVRILLTRTAREKAVPIELIVSAEVHDAWFRAKVLEAMRDPRPAISNEEAKLRMADHKARAAARRAK